MNSGRARPAFTLVELVIIIVVLGTMAAVAIPRMGGAVGSAKTAATREEMQRLKQALVGNPAALSGGRYSDAGYLGDVGGLPPTLQGLVTRPAGVPSWDPYRRLGWHGPYVDSTAGEYLRDAWGTDYVYDPVARTLTSTGSGAGMVLNF